jgi:hypothetical protein
MTPEGRITAGIVRWLKLRRSQGAEIWWVKLWGNPLQRAGLPDFVIAYRGRFLAVEVKRHGGSLTRIQAHTLDEMKAAGFVAVVARSVDDVVCAMKETSPPPAA